MTGITITVVVLGISWAVTIFIQRRRFEIIERRLSELEHR